MVVDPADEVTATNVAQEQVKCGGRLGEVAIAHGQRWNNAVRQSWRNGASARPFAVAAAVKGPVGREFGTAIRTPETDLDVGPLRRKSCSSRIISTRTSPRRSTKRFLPPRHGGSWNGSSGTTRPNMGVGWIWLNPNSVFCRSSASTGEIPDQQLLKEEVDAWEADRNKKHAKADWRFTTENARVKLKRLYPALRTTWPTSMGSSIDGV